MIPTTLGIDQYEEHFLVHMRRESPSTRPPRRESPRFSSKRGKTSFVGGAHRRGKKRTGL